MAVFYTVENSRSLATAPNEREYVIQQDDTLYNIAKLHLGDGERWPELMTANKDRMDDPEKLIVGLTIRLPLQKGVF